MGLNFGDFFLVCHSLSESLTWYLWHHLCYLTTVGVQISLSTIPIKIWLHLGLELPCQVQSNSAVARFEKSSLALFDTLFWICIELIWCLLSSLPLCACPWIIVPCVPLSRRPLKGLKTANRFLQLDRLLMCNTKSWDPQGLSKLQFACELEKLWSFEFIKYGAGLLLSPSCKSIDSEVSRFVSGLENCYHFSFSLENPWWVSFFHDKCNRRMRHIS